LQRAGIAKWEVAVIIEKRNVLDNLEQRESFEKEAADALTRHYKCPIAILSSWRPGEKPDMIDLRAAPDVFDEHPHNRIC
jgi:hypothetical protein